MGASEEIRIGVSALVLADIILSSAVHVRPPMVFLRHHEPRSVLSSVLMHSTLRLVFEIVRTSVSAVVLADHETPWNAGGAAPASVCGEMQFEKGGTIR